MVARPQESQSQVTYQMRNENRQKEILCGVTGKENAIGGPAHLARGSGDLGSEVWSAQMELPSHLSIERDSTLVRDSSCSTRWANGWRVRHLFRTA